MWFYTEKVKDLFKNPKNVGEIENADAVGEVGNIVCGDALRLTLKIDDKTHRIEDARFKTFGCASAIASSSALTEMIKGMTVEEAARVTNEDIARYLGGLPREKMHCSVMGMEALEAAIADFKGLARPGEEQTKGEKVVCKCFNVTEEKIIRAIKENNLKTVEDVTNYTKAGGGCGRCRDDIAKLLEEHRNLKTDTGTKPSSGRGKGLTNLEKITRVKETIEREIRLRLRADGGDIELVDIKGDTVFVKFLGTCLDCPSAGVTLRGLVESKLREFAGKDISVKEVG